MHVLKMLNLLCTTSKFGWLQLSARTLSVGVKRKQNIFFSFPFIMARLTLSSETKDLLESKSGPFFACHGWHIINLCKYLLAIFIIMSHSVSIFLTELSDENQLSVVKRKGLVEHLIRTSQQPRGQHEAYGPRQRPFIRRSKTSLDNLTVLRKKETIVKSGAYERSQIAPPKGKGNNKWYLE